MNSHFPACTSWASALGALLLLSAPAPANPQSAPGLDPKHRGLLETHCQSCHGPEKQKGRFRVDDLPGPISTVEQAEKWQKILNALNAGEMPPEDEKQPDNRAKADFLEDLAHVMVAARKSLSDQHGKTVLRRLNRREYRNTLRELLGPEIEVNELPADTRLGGFDTTGTSLFMSSDQFEQYEALGREALEEAFALQTAAPLQKKFRVEAETTLESFTKKNQLAHEDLSRATAWVKAANEAIANPANAGKVAELRKTLLTDESLRHAWEKIPGAPPPERYGFPNMDVQVIHELAANTQFVAYEHRYLQMPGLKTGAYLTIPFVARSQHANNHIPLTIPADWPVGTYTVRVCVGVLPETPPERRFLEFGIGHNPFGKSPFLSTHHVVGTVEKPQIIETLYKASRKLLRGQRINLFVRERGVGDALRSEQFFRETRKQNGIGPDLALWVDWIEIERQPVPEADTPPGIRALQGVPLDDKGGLWLPKFSGRLWSGFPLKPFAGSRRPGKRSTVCSKSTRLGLAGAFGIPRLSNPPWSPCSPRRVSSTRPNPGLTSSAVCFPGWNWPPASPTCSGVLHRTLLCAPRPPRANSWSPANWPPKPIASSRTRVPRTL